MTMQEISHKNATWKTLLLIDRYIESGQKTAPVYQLYLYYLSVTKLSNYFLHYIHILTIITSRLSW